MNQTFELPSLLIATVDPIAVCGLVVAIVSLLVSVIAAWANSMQVRLLSQQFSTSVSPLLVCNLVEKSVSVDSLNIEISLSNVGKETIIIGSVVLRGKSNIGDGIISVVAELQSNCTILPGSVLSVTFIANKETIHAQLGDIGNPLDASLVVDFSVEALAWTPPQEALGKPANKLVFYSPFSSRLSRESRIKTPVQRIESTSGLK